MQLAANSTRASHGPLPTVGTGGASRLSMGELSTVEKAEAFVTWRSAITVNALIAIVAALGPSSGVLNLPGIGRPFVVSRIVTIVLTIGLIGVLIPQRNGARLSVFLALFVLPAVPVLVMNWFLAGERAAQGLPVELFVREASASAVYALSAPPKAIVSLVPIAAFSLESLLVYWTARGSPSGQLPRWQPWTGLLYGTCMALIAVYRARRQQREVETIVKLEQAAALRGLIRSYLAVRDLLNTPLQTLRVSAHLLRVRYPAAKRVTGAMERAVGRLDELNQLLAEEASAVEWPSGTEAFDPVNVLRASRSKPEP